METQELHRGRLIDHIQLVVKDLDASKKFYKAVLNALDIPMGGEADDHFWFDEIFVSSLKSPASGMGQTTGRNHVAFQARDEKMVQAFYKQTMEAGGKDNGKPGERPYHPGYYAAFVIDPDGNNIEAVYHGPAKKSANSIKITFE